MSYFKNLFNAVIGNTTKFDLSRMNSTEIDEFLRIAGGGQSISGQVVNEKTVLAITTAWRCINLITNAVSTMPRDLYIVDGENREPAVNHPLRKLIRNRPNEMQTPKEFFDMQMAWLLLRGNCYAVKVEGFRGETVALIPLPASAVQPKELDNGETVFEYTRPDGKKITYPRKKLLHVKGLSLDGKTGLSALTYARESLGLSIDGQVAASTLMKNGSFVDGVITVPNALSEQAYKRLKDSWNTHRSGVDNAGETAILEEGAELKKLSMSAADLQFLEQRTWQKHDIAEFFGVPGHMIGLTEKSTSWGSGIEQMTIAFVSYTLNNYLVSWEEALIRDCIQSNDQTEYSVDFDTRGLLRGDSKARWDTYTRGRQWGIYSPNDVRRFEGLNPRSDPEGDEYAAPPNQTKDEGEQEQQEEPDEE